MAHRDFSVYLTWSDDDEARRLVCTDAGQARVPPGSAYPPPEGSHPPAYRSVATGRVIGGYQLVYITAGRGFFRSGDEDYPVGAGSVLAVFPGLRHAYRPDPSTGWEEFWVGFRGDLADALRDTGMYSPRRPCLRPGLHSPLVDMYDAIFSTLLGCGFCHQLRAGGLLLQLLAEVLVRSGSTGHSDGTVALVEGARLAMQEAVDGPLRIDSIAADLGVSRERLSSAFKTATGLTPYQYFIQLKINKAKLFLDSGDMSIKEVAAGLGFEDPYYFSRLFKKKTGLAPSAWMAGAGQPDGMIVVDSQTASWQQEGS